MNKFYAALFLLATSIGFSQPIAVSTSSHSVPQLVNDVLINSTCVSATNITWRTGSNFGSANGIGYFTNTNPAFPMQGGVVLSTGNALNAAGPNAAMLNDGSAAWLGDEDLEATLAAAGISMQSVNATVLEFDFTPISAHFNFDFVFASEEYGNFQCQFSDAFAFLLTNMATGETVNLAVVPTTNVPISVVTIRDYLYNSSCPSANAQYFGTYNGGSAAAASATNFNGQTVLMNASSQLVPNTPYHIKLVIADRSDLESDSAIFISSNSFNIGQDVLGLDLTVQNGTAICEGQSYELNTGLNPAEYTMSWTRNGVAVAGATGPSLTITQPGTYGITYSKLVGNCAPVTDYITVEFYPTYAIPNPQNLYRCGTGSLWFNLALNTPVVTGTLTPAPAITYHATQADAQAGTNALALNYASTGGETIYVRAVNPANGCFTVKSFQLIVTNGVVAGQPDNMAKCARSATLLNSFFNFNVLIPQILNGQPAASHLVTFHLTQPDAVGGINAIPNPQHFLSGGQTIYARLQNATDASCFDVTSFTTSIDPRPEVENLDDVIVCDNFVLPVIEHGSYYSGANGTGVNLPFGSVIEETSTIYIYSEDPVTGCSATTDFKVTVIDPNQLSPNDGTYCGFHTLPALQLGKYYTQPGGQGSVIPFGTTITESQTVYYYYQTTEEPFCAIDTDFTINILPVPTLPEFENVFDCVSYTLPALAVGKYYTEPLGQGQEIPAGTTITSTTTVYVYVANTNATPVCADADSFNVIIGISTPSDINQCEPYTLPAVSIGNYYTGPNATGTLIPAGTVINQTTSLYLNIPASAGSCSGDIAFTVSIAQPLIDSLPNVSVCDSFILPELTSGTYYTGPNGTGDVLQPGDVISETKTIYIFKAASAVCSNESSFTVTVLPLPQIDSRSDIDVCNAYTLTQLTHGNYYTGPNGTGTLLPAGTVLTQSQTVYIFAQSNSTPACTSENSFELFIFSVEADAPAPVTACDSYVLPALTIGNYYTLPGGPSVAGQTMKNAGDIITTSTTLYIYTESGERINCSDENPFSITINATPVIAAPAPVRACHSYVLPALPAGQFYYTASGATGTALTAGTEITASTTLYIYSETGTTPNCFAEQPLNITIFNVDELADVTTCENYTLPALTVGKYYTGPNGTGTQLQPGAVLNASQTVYIYAQAPWTPLCLDESSFAVTIIAEPTAFAVPAVHTTVCDEDGTNDGIVNFDLTALNSFVLGTQTGTEFSVTWHATIADAEAGVNAITSTTQNLIYVRVNNSLAPSCFAVRPITIKVNKLPAPTPQDGIICYDMETGTLINAYVIQSGLPAGTHSFAWRNEAGTIVGTGNTYTAIVPGVYTLTAVNLATGCASEEVAVTVTPSEPAEITYEITEAFADQQSITVTASGTGEYEYALDHGDFQDSNVFENVSPGMHTVTVRDKNGCGSSSVEVLVINYPKFFTPNGDGYNDTWNIKDLSDQEEAAITIYDRYGKVITQIKPEGQGWDGTYLGNMLPSTDYWFSVTFKDEDNQPREFRAHFSMKR